MFKALYLCFCLCVFLLECGIKAYLILYTGGVNKVKIKKIITTLALVTIMGGVTISTTSCHSGSNNSSTAPVIQSLVYLHSNFVDSQILTNNHKYSLLIIDETTGSILINDNTFSCKELTENSGCKINLPKYESNRDDLIFIISDGVGIVAAETVKKSFLPLGLNHIYFNEETTGSYLYDNLFNTYAVLGNNDEVRRSMYNFFNLNPDDHNDDINFNIMLYKLYTDYQKTYGENTFFFMVDFFNKNNMDLNPKHMNELNSDNSQTSNISRANSSITSAVPKFEQLVPGGCISPPKNEGGKYTCIQAGGKQVAYDKNVIDNAIVEGKKIDKAIQDIYDSNLTPEDKKAKEKELIAKRNKEMEGLIKDITPNVQATASMLKSAAGIKVSKDTQDTIKTFQTMITVVGAVGNAWLPGVSSAIAGLANGVLDGLFIDNVKAVNANPNAAVEAILEQISNKIDTVNNSVLLVGNKLNSMQYVKSAEDINKNKLKIRNVTGQLNTYFSDMLTYADMREESYLAPVEYLPQYLNSNELAIPAALDVFGNKKDNKDLLVWLGIIVNEADAKGSKFTTYMDSYQEKLDEDLKNATGELFSPSRNRINIVQEYNSHAFKYGSEIISLIYEVDTFYKTAAYLKYKSNKPEFKEIDLGVYNSQFYDKSVASIDKNTKMKVNFVAEAIQTQIDRNVERVQHEYLNKFDDNLKRKFTRVNETGYSECEARYWDGKTLVGRCGIANFVIPDLFNCKQNVNEVNGRVSCPVLSFANSEMFEEGSAGKERSKALANMLQTRSNTDRKNEFDVAYIAAEWSYNREGIRYNNLYASLYPFMKENEGSKVFMNYASRTECFEHTDDSYGTNPKAEGGNGWGGKSKYGKTAYYNPDVFNYLYINKTTDTKGQTCPDGVLYANWWADGKLVDWNSSDVNEGNSLHRTYVDIQDFVTQKKFLIPMITTYSKGGFFSDRSYRYYSTLGCRTSDCIVFDAGGKDGDHQNPAVIGWLDDNLELDPTIYILGLQGNHDMGYGKYAYKYALQVDKIVNAKHPIAADPFEGIFTISKSDIGFYTNNGSLTPHGDWLTKCQGRQFINGMLVSAAKCDGVDGKENKNVASLDWANNCVPGTAVNVDNNGNLFCRNPRPKN